MAPATSARAPELLASGRTATLRSSGSVRCTPPSGTAPFGLYAAAQCIHQIHHVAGLRRRRARRAAGLLGSDQFFERGLVAILELRWIEPAFLSLQDVLGEIECVPGNLGIRDI